MKVKLVSIEAKEIFTKTKLPGCDYVINQYIGCQHACLYCYAKFISRWRPNTYGKWGTWVEAKINAPELVKNRYIAGKIYMSSISDPYQEAEKELKLTRNILKNLDKRTNLSIQTKSDLILRDINIFKKFKNIEIGFTINTFNEKEGKLFEPFSSSNKERIEALKKIKKERINTFVFISPIIPDLINLEKIIEETKNFTDYYWFEFINLAGAGKEFIETLKKEFPKSYEILQNKKVFAEFIKKSKEIIISQKIKVYGVESH